MPTNPIEEPEGLPVFLINGFLEAGKTQFLKFTLDQDYFQTEGTTLLLLCEEGEEEYDEALLKRTHTTVVKVDSEEDITTEKLTALEVAYKPERVIIEWNGMWQQYDLKLPDGWFMNQVVTIIDTSTFDLYLKNMKPLLGQMLRWSELVICNRADDIPEDTLANYRLSIRGMSANSTIVFEGAQGEITGDFNVELPYDLDQDSFVINNDDFGVFYVDSMDRPEKYDGKTVTFAGQILKPKELAPNDFVVGRMVMACCVQDMQFLGPICCYEGISAYRNEDWVKITATIRAEDREEYGEVGPVMYVKEVVRTGKIDGVVSLY